MNPQLDPKHPAYEHPYTTTNSGVNVYAPDRFDASQVRMSDIMDGISKICRYNGQIDRFYSVAEHSVLVSRIAEYYRDEEALLPSLFHDAHEAYSGDLPTPHKTMVPALLGFERAYEERVREALDLPPSWDPVWQRVAHYDALILHREVGVMRASNLPEWHDPKIEAQVPNHVQPVGLAWQEARGYFRDRMYDLGLGLGGNL